MVPEARWNFSSRLSQVSLSTELYVDLHSVVAGVVEQSSSGVQIGVVSQISLLVSMVFAAWIARWSIPYSSSFELEVSPLFDQYESKHVSVSFCTSFMAYNLRSS